MGDSTTESYLRVLTPQTIDGVNLKYAEGGERVLFKETHLPLTARKHLEAENANLPQQLKHKIEVVVSAEPVKPKGRPGRPPKSDNPIE